MTGGPRDRRANVALTATVLHVDLSRGTVDTRTIPEDTYRKYPGGSALAAYLLLQNTSAGADPLGPANALVMAEHARDTYYHLSGCDPETGYPTRAKLADLGLDWLAGQGVAAR